MKILIIIFLLSISLMAEVPKSVNDVIVKFKVSEMDPGLMAPIIKTLKRNRMKGFVKTGHPKFDKLAEELNFEELDYGYLTSGKPLKTGSKKSKIHKKLNLGNVVKIAMEENKDIEGLVSKLEESGLFEYVAIPEKVTINSIIPDDKYYAYQWPLNSNNSSYSGTDAIVSADLDMESAWDITTGSSATIVAILDTGNRVDHPELDGRIWVNQGEIPSNSIDDDGNGKVDDYYGWNFTANSGDIVDNGGHGTHVAGIIGAKGGNGSLIAGMDWNTQLMAVKVLDDDGNGTTSMWHDGIIYAVDNGADVINMSLGGQISYKGTINYVQEAIDYAYEHGVVVVVSSGNDNSGEENYYPAACDSVICVGSTDDKGERSNFSNYGSHIDVMAPGNIIWSLDYNDYNKVSGMSGTSQAAPHVTGLISLMKGLNPPLPISDIFSAIRETAVDQIGSFSEDTPGFDNYFGYGLINPVAALTLINPESNSAPKILSQAKILSVEEDGELAISVSDIIAEDVDGDLLSLTINMGENYTFDGNIIYPNKDYSGYLVVEVYVSDGRATSNVYSLSINVKEVNDTPIIHSQDSSITIGKGESFVIEPEYLSYSDTDDSELSLEILDGDNYEHDIDEVYPDVEFEGDLNVNITLSDGKSYSEEFVYILSVGYKLSTSVVALSPENERGNDKLIIAPIPLVANAIAYYDAKESGLLEILIYSKKEDLLKKISRQVETGENIFKMSELNSFKKGIYYVVFKLNGKIDVIKVIVKIE